MMIELRIPPDHAFQLPGFLEVESSESDASFDKETL